MESPYKDDRASVVDVGIIGAGFSGCSALYKLRLQGLTAKVLEAGSDFGGVWHFNRYPGARVDSDTPSYQLNIAKVWESFNFTERYPSHEELRKYFTHMDDILDLRKDTVFNARVKEVRYDVRARTWSLSTTKGLRLTCRFVVFGTGSLTKPYVPAFARLDEFAGQVIHPRHWPDGLDVRGKRIGIIGQGATGLQIVQELAKQDCKLSVFVRSPCIAVPMRQRSLSFEETEQMKNLYEGIFFKAKYGSASALPYNQSYGKFGEATELEQQARYERLWARGGLGLTFSNYVDIMKDEAANSSLYNFWVHKVRSRMSNGEKMDIVAPLRQSEHFGCRRVNLEEDYYEMLDRPNVEVVDLKARPIREFHQDGILVGRHLPAQLIPLDVVVFATGYDSFTGSLFDMNIYDKHGVRLQKRWGAGISTYLGMVADGLPNAFFLYGPQAPTSQANAPPFIELQVDWIAAVLRKLRAEGLKSFEVSADACRMWKGQVKSEFEKSLMKESRAWWTGANIPGKTQEPMIYFGGVKQWTQECRQALADWSRFSVEGV
ncbi:cyclopentanone -monooxygenase [Colletotrichum camelliae]|nr:cyclopentanone -monooxygenase [Colletotrichum camelliae]